MFAFDKQFINPVWSSLNDGLQQFGKGNVLARRFDPDVLPFVAVRDNSAECANAFDELTFKGDEIYVVGIQPSLAAHWQIKYQGDVVQMMLEGALPRLRDVQQNTMQVSELTAAHVDDMLQLTAIAYGGFFRPGTCHVGKFLGIRVNNQLVSMLGTRMQFGSYCEITTICTHPDHTGKGYSTRLLHDMLVHLLNIGKQAFLHVDARNERAIQLYRHNGFKEFNRVFMQKLLRV